MNTETAEATHSHDGQNSELIELTTSAGLVIPAIGAPWPGQGGIYVGQLPPAGDRPGVHLVVSELEADRTWGAYGVDVPGATSRHNGRANTQALLAHQQDGEHTHPAAQFCAEFECDGHKDFHLPSLLELQVASALAPDVFDQDPYYWTSTQGSPRYAFVQDFELGYSGWYYEDNARRVRAVRWIQL